jgi:hypothetical protein
LTTTYYIDIIQTPALKLSAIKELLNERLISFSVWVTLTFFFLRQDFLGQKVLAARDSQLRRGGRRREILDVCFEVLEELMGDC